MEQKNYRNNTRNRQFVEDGYFSPYQEIDRKCHMFIVDHYSLQGMTKITDQINLDEADLHFLFVRQAHLQLLSATLTLKFIIMKR